jgi:hypothetical protein
LAQYVFEILDDLGQDLAGNVWKRNFVINAVIFKHVIYVCDSKATTSSISKVSPFELLRVIFLLKKWGFDLEFETVFPLCDL